MTWKRGYFSTRRDEMRRSGGKRGSEDIKGRRRKEDKGRREQHASGVTSSDPTHQLRSIICLSNTSFATISGRADLVCHTETERSSAPSATTEQIFDVATGLLGSRRNI